LSKGFKGKTGGIGGENERSVELLVLSESELVREGIRSKGSRSLAREGNGKSRIDGRRVVKEVVVVESCD
jgi:hypothetical protein